MQIDSDGFILWDCEIEFVGILSFWNLHNNPSENFIVYSLLTRRNLGNQTYKSKQVASNMRMWWKISENLHSQTCACAKKLAR